MLHFVVFHFVPVLCHVLDAEIKYQHVQTCIISLQEVYYDDVEQHNAKRMIKCRRSREKTRARCSRCARIRKHRRRNQHIKHG